MTAGQTATAAKYEYSAYNLAIRSDIELPEFPASTGGEGFDIRLDASAGLPERRSIEWREQPEFEARFDYPGLARFVVRAGRELIISPHPEGDAGLFRLYVQGMMLAAALSQRGYYVLHASVVDLGGFAVAFTGHVGAGKSTLATAFHALGFKILADDNAALDLQVSPPRVLPAFPSLKVYPAVAHSLGIDIAALRPMHASQIKQAHVVGDAFSSSPLPLRCIYVLDRSYAAPPVRISPVESVTELIRHSVPTRWAVPGNARHLRQCARTAQSVPIFRARTFRALDEIPEIADGIERHASGI